MPSELWQRLRAARNHANKTQLDVASACGVSREAVSLWESPDPARRSNPGIPRLRIFAAVTGAPLEWLLNDSADLDVVDWTGGVAEPPAEYVSGQPLPEGVVDLPVFSRRREGIESPNSLTDYAIGSLLFQRKSLERKGISIEHAEVHYAPDDSMAPFVRAGSAVLLDGSQTEIFDGRMYVVSLVGQELIRRLYRELDGGVLVRAHNAVLNVTMDRKVPANASPDVFRVLGRVRWIGSWED